jgi:hypothetical protein
VFWERLKQLEEQGLIDFIPHLCEGDTADAELIHPFGIDWSEKGLENRENAVGQAAYRAGMVMRKQGDNRKWTEYLAPVPRGYPDVQMVGVARLRYRPHTKRTSQWWAVLQARLPEYIKTYEALREKTEMGRLDIKGCQGESKVFNGSQGISRGEAVKDSAV